MIHRDRLKNTIKLIFSLFSNSWIVFVIWLVRYRSNSAITQRIQNQKLCLRDLNRPYRQLNEHEK